LFFKSLQNVLKTSIEFNEKSGNKSEAQFAIDEGYCSLRMAKIASNFRFIDNKFPCSKFCPKKN